MITVVPFQVADENDNLDSPQAAIIEASDAQQAIRDFVAACVYPHADSNIWGEVADQGSSPERLSDIEFYICTAGEDEETGSILLKILERKVKTFKSAEEAEDYLHSELRASSWAFDNRGAE